MDHPLHNVGIAEKSCLKEPCSACNTRCPPGCLLWCSPVREQFAVPYNEDTLLHLQVSFHHKYFMSLSLLYPTIHRSACISWQRPRFPHRSMGIALLLRLPYWALSVITAFRPYVHLPWLLWHTNLWITKERGAPTAITLSCPEAPGIAWPSNEQCRSPTLWVLLYAVDGQKSRHIRIYYTYGASHCFVSDGLFEIFPGFQDIKTKAL